MSTPREGEYLPKEWIEVSEVHGDLSQEVVRITVDRLTLILHRHVSSVERRKEWIAPAGILTTLILTFVSTTFQRQDPEERNLGGALYYGVDRGRGLADCGVVAQC